MSQGRPLWEGDIQTKLRKQKRSQLCKDQEKSVPEKINSYLVSHHLVIIMINILIYILYLCVWVPVFLCVWRYKWLLLYSVFALFIQQYIVTILSAH